MDSGHNFEVGAGYVEAELTNKETDASANYGGLAANISFNYLLTTKNYWHTYLGFQAEYAKLENNANNSTQSEDVTYISPGLQYGLHYKRLSLGASYHYVMAETTSTGAGLSNVDYDIHRLGLKIGLDYRMSDNFYIVGSYKFNYGLVSGLSQDHSFQSHVVGVNLVFLFGTTRATESGPKPTPRRRNKKRSGLFNFFDVN